MQFMYEYYAIEKQNILYAFNAAASSCRRVSFLQLFESLFSPHSLRPVIRIFLNKFVFAPNLYKCTNSPSKLDFRR